MKRGVRNLITFLLLAFLAMLILPIIPQLFNMS